jgi:hypothetical protein
MTIWAARKKAAPGRAEGAPFSGTKQPGKLCNESLLRRHQQSNRSLISQVSARPIPSQKKLSL